MKKKVQKLLSVLLALMILVQIVQMSVYAQDNTGKEDVKETTTNELAACSDSETPNIVCEIEDKRTEYSKTFKMDDGSFCEFNSVEPLHYFENNSWKDLSRVENESLTVQQFTSRLEDEKVNKEKSSTRGGASHSSSLTSLHKCFTKQGSSFVESSTPIVKYNNSRILFRSQEPGTNIGNTRFILNAKLILNCTSISLNGDSSNYIAIKKAVQPWNENTTTYSFSGLSNKSYDNENVITTGVYDWDITELYNLWETGETPNYGVVLIEADTKTRNAIAQFSLNPYFVINYREISSLDDDFPTYSFDMGRAGTVVVNEFTNDTIVIRDDLGIDGAALPVFLKSYIYENNFTAVEQYGHNRSFNYNSVLKENNGVFEWHTIDGHIIEFYRDISYQGSPSFSKWIDSSENYTLMVKMQTGNIIDWDYSDNYIECVDSTTYYFDSGNGNWANLVRITDSNNKEINITYQNGLISTIADGAGREYRFIYNDINPDENIITLALNNISIYPDSNSNSAIGFTSADNLSRTFVVSYGYELSNSSGNILLTSVTYQDGLSVTYTYDNDDKLETVTNIDGAVFRVSNTGGSISNKIYAKYKDSNSASPLDSITIDNHISYRREIINSFDERTEYFFNRLLKIQYYKKYTLDNNGFEELIEAEQYDYNADGTIKSIMKLDGENANTLLINPDFEDIYEEITDSESGWYTEDDENVIIDDKTDYSLPYDGGGLELSINGNIREEKNAYQLIDVSDEEMYPDGTPIGISGWGKAGVNCVSAPEHFFGIKVWALYQSQSNNQNVEDEVCSVPFETNIIDEWQCGTASFRLQRIKNGLEITELKVSCEFDYQRANSVAYFDNLKMFTTDDYYEVPGPTVCNCINCNYGVGCPCECVSEAVCNCFECNGISTDFCACGSSCHFGDGCQCECASASVCNCVSCKSYTYVDTDSVNHKIRTVTTDGTKDMVFEKTYSSDDNYVTSEVDENGVEIIYNYANSKNGLITSSQDSYGTTTYAYDAMGRLAEIKTAVSGLSNGATHIKNEYSYQNDRISSITHNGFTYSFLYNDYGDYYIVKVGNQDLITYGYNDKQQVNSITYSNGNTINYEYSGENLVKVKDLNNDVIYQYDYDDEGNLIKITDFISGLTTELNVTKHIIHAAYFIGRKVKEMNEANAAYIAETGDSTPENLPYGSSSFNNVLPDDLLCEEIVYRTDNPRDIRYARVIEDEGTYEYFAEDEFYKYNTETKYNPVTGISVNSTKTDIEYNWNSLTTAYSQDCFGRVVNTEDMKDLIGASVYEDSGAAKVIVEKNSQNLPKSINKTNYYYNDSTTVVRQQIQGLSSDITNISGLNNADDFYKKYHDIDAYWFDYPDYSLTYDNSNRLIRVYRQTGNTIDTDIRYTYNNDNQIVREDYLTQGNERTYVFSYDNNGKICRRCDYLYTLGELGTQLFSSLVVYNENNETYYSTEYYGWHYTYEYSYVYDNNGNITEVYDGLDETTRSLLVKYSYDNAGQLIREDNALDNKSYTYTYDAGGNIVQKNEYAYTLNSLGSATDTINYSYDLLWKDELVNYDGKLISYDSIGNPVTYGTGNILGEEYRKFEWDGKHLISCSIFNYGNNSDLNCKYIFEYDYEGNLSRVTSYSSCSVSNGQLVPDETTARITEFTWKNGNLVYQCINPKEIATVQPSNCYPSSHEQDASLTIKYLYDDNGEPYGCITEGDRLFYYQKNLQGDITGVIQPRTQKCFLTYSYDAFGNMSYEMHYSSISELLAAMTLLNNQLLTYRGYMYNFDTGFYYLHSRFYVPEWGRFLNADVICDTNNGAIGTNVYAYCDNNPVNRVDPTGFASVIVNIYSGMLGHADISIGDTTYAFGNYQATNINRWDQIIGKAQGYLIVANSKSWSDYQRKSRRIDKFIINVTTPEKDAILKYCKAVENKSRFDRSPKNYNGTVYKVNEGEYSKYSVIFNNCVSFTIRALASGIRNKLANVSWKAYNNSSYYVSIISPASLEYFMYEYMNYYPKTQYKMLPRQ